MRLTGGVYVPVSDISEEKIHAAADAMVAKGLKEAGYTYLNLVRRVALFPQAFYLQLIRCLPVRPICSQCYDCG